MSKPKKQITEFRSYHLPLEFPLLLLTGDHWKISDKPSVHLHFHNCLEIGICHEGSGVLTIRSEELPFQKNDITIISQNIPHTTRSDTQQLSKWSYIFVELPQFFDSFASSNASQLSHILNILDHSACILHNQEDSPRLLYLLKLIDVINKAGNCYQFYAKTLLLAFVLDLNQTAEFLSSSTQDDTDQYQMLAIVPALEHIKKNYMQQFSVDSLSMLCGLSATHFRRIFNSTMGVSPLEYVNTVRINLACDLLRSTDDSILDISESVGFHSISSFNRYFDRLIGMSPREYRKASPDEALFHNSKIMKYNGWMEPDL